MMQFISGLDDGVRTRIIKVTIKVKLALEQAIKARGGVTVQIYSFFNFGSGSGWSRPRPGSFTSGKETRCPFYRRLSEPQGCSGRLRKISPTPPSKNRSADRRYTNYAIQAHLTRVGRG